MSDTNAFGDYTEVDYQRLRDDIAKRGVLVPLEYDQHGALVDGHHRLRACQELGIEAPVVVRTFADARERLLHQIALNAIRRHLSPKRRHYFGWNYEQMSLGLEESPQEPPARKVDPEGWNPSEMTIHQTERQRWHRLKEKCRPKQPAPMGSNPLQLCADTLDALEALKEHVPARHHADVDEIAERVRQVVWGPA